MPHATNLAIRAGRAADAISLGGIVRKLTLQRPNRRLFHAYFNPASS
jgi:hypothetical protein